MQSRRGVAKVVARLLRSQVQCVLATVSPTDNSPSTHLMAYGFERTLRQVYFATGRHTRKDKNMRAHPAVSILWDDRTGNLGDHHSGTLATANGAAQALADGSLGAEVARDLILASNPNMTSFVTDESTSMFVVTVQEWGVVEGYGSMRLWNPQEDQDNEAVDEDRPKSRL